VVSHDDLLVLRIRDSLASDELTVVARASDVTQLSDAAAAAAAIVLAGSRTVSSQRMLIRAAAARFPGVPSVIVASLAPTGVRKALEAGAYGVVLDSEIEAALAPTIRAVSAGQVVVPHRFHRQAIRPPLSHREKETLTLVARGLTNREIAASLYLAESTVKTHLGSIFGKLGVGSRSEAAALVLDPDENLGLGAVDLAPARIGQISAR
jgi:DNA-binding NarL/FixJ family response regulator